MRLKHLIAVSVIIPALIGCGGGETATFGQTVSITSPDTGALLQQVGGVADIPVNVTTSDMPSDGGVEFVLDAGSGAQQSWKDFSAPYQCTFPQVRTGEHRLDVYVITRREGRTSAHDQKINIGVGDIIVAMGDSITAGEEDDIFTDNWSADGRTGPHIDSVTGKEYGGFEPILADLLAAEFGYPVMIVNKGVPGDTSLAAANNAYAIATQYPTARTWLLSYGTNDAGRSIAASSVKANLEAAIQHIREINPDAVVYIPKILYSTRALVPEYHNKFGDIIRNTPGVFWGADHDTLFHANHNLYDHLTSQPGTWFSANSSHHPNGLGVQKMAMLWRMALVDKAILVTDGVLGGTGDTWADKIRVEGANTIGLSQVNLLQVCEQSPRGDPPQGTSFLSLRDFGLQLTNASDFAGGHLTATVRVEADNLPPVGANSWNQVWLASGLTVLPTTRAVDPQHPNNHHLTATVTQPGQLACVVDVTPPATLCLIDPPTPDDPNGWYSAPPTIILIAPGGSGWPDATVRYRWDSGSESVCTGPLMAPRGTHTLYFHAVDQSGNAETEQAVTFSVGSECPSKPVVSDNAGFIEPPDTVHVTWRVADPGAGVAGYMFSVGATPGGCEMQNWTDMGLATECDWAHESVPPGTNLFFSVKACSPTGRWSWTGSSDGVAVPVPVSSIGAAKRLRNSTPVAISDVIVTAELGDVVYVEEWNRSAGIGVLGVDAGAVAPGMKTRMLGWSTVRNGGVMLLGAETRGSETSMIPRPIGLCAGSLHTDSVTGKWYGVTTTSGLLVRVWGKVTTSDGISFQLWDGEALHVDASYIHSIPAVGSVVSVTGICTPVYKSGVLKPAITPRSDVDVMTIRP